MPPRLPPFWPDRNPLRIPLTTFSCVGELCEQVEDLGGGERLAVVVALGDVTAVAVSMAAVAEFSTPSATVVRPRVWDKSMTERTIAATRGSSVIDASERAVEFDLVDRQVAEVIQRAARPRTNPLRPTKSSQFHSTN